MTLPRAEGDIPQMVNFALSRSLSAEKLRENRSGMGTACAKHRGVKSHLFGEGSSSSVWLAGSVPGSQHGTKGGQRWAGFGPGPTSCSVLYPSAFHGAFVE